MCNNATLNQNSIPPQRIFTNKPLKEESINPELLRSSLQKSIVSQYELSNPLWGEFFRELSFSHLKIDIDPQDPIVDEDPFFLRGQSWEVEPVPLAEEGFSFRRTSQSIEIRSPQLKNSESPKSTLKINTPFIPIIETENYILMTLPENSPLLTKVLENGQTSSNPTSSLDSNQDGGLFFISKEEFFQMEQLQWPLQVYFIPLPGSGWTGFLQAIELPDFNKVVVETKSQDQISEYVETYPLDIDDFSEIMKIQKLTRMLAIVDRMMIHPKESEFQLENLLFPLPRSTAGFGMIGMNSVPVSSMETVFQKVKNKFQSLVSNLNLHLLPKAQAFDFQFSPDVLNQLAIYGKLLGGILGTSIVLKYTLLRDRLKQLHLLEKEEREKSRKHWIEKQPQDLERQLKKLKDPGPIQEFLRDTFSIFAHGTTAMSQLGPVGMGTAIELFFDKTLPEYAASNNKLLRKILYKTILWGKESVSRVPVNWKTFLLGALVLGLMVDTPFVAMQDLIFYPWLATVLYHSFPEGFAEKLYQSFVVDFETNKKTLIQGIFRSGSSWLMSGASHFAMDSKAQILTKAQTEVDDQLKAEGYQLSDPKVQDIRTKRIDSMVDQICRQRGLPGSESFLFDLNTIIYSFYRGWGYQAPRTEIDNSEVLQRSFLLEQRPGLAKNALRKSVRIARQRVEEEPSQENKDVLQLLEKTYKDMNLLQWDLLLSPIERLKAYRKVRTTLTLLSYSGSLNEIVQYWATDYSAITTQFAGQLFRKVLFGYLYADKNEGFLPSTSIVQEFGERAEINVRNRVIMTAHLNQEQYSQWIQTHSLEYETELEEEIRELKMEKDRLEKIRSYAPPKEDFLEKIQKRRALEKTVLDFTNTADLENANSREQWIKIYSHNLSREIGLYINSNTRDSLLSEAHSKASVSTQKQMNETLGLREYLGSLTNYQRLQFEANLYSVQFLSAYRDLTTRDTDKGDVDFKEWKKRMILPDQPGFFQRVRQTRWVTKSNLLTRFFRANEMFFDDEEILPGVKPWIKRNIPLASDFMGAASYLGKNLFIQTTGRFLVHKEIFAIKWSWPTYSLYAIIAPWMIYMPSMVLARAFRQQGLKAMDTFRSKLFYGLIYTNVTMGATIPLILFNEPVQKFMNDTVFPTLTKLYSSVPEEVLLGLGLSAGISLLPQVREWVGNRMKNFPMKYQTGKSEKVILRTPNSSQIDFQDLSRSTRILPINCSALLN